MEANKTKSFKEVNDAVWGQIDFPIEIYKIIDTPLFQRLRQLKQNGNVHMIYPSANHSRFSHSLGVCKLASDLLKVLKERSPDEYNLSPKEELCVKIAALLHDVGHGPFSHLWDEHIVKNEAHEHEHRSCILVKKILEECLTEFEMEDIVFVQSLIHWDHSDETALKKSYQKHEKKGWVYHIIANADCGLDVDKLDYIVRDADRTIQTEVGIKEVQRIMNHCRIKPSGEGLMYSKNVADNVASVFYARFRLHKNVYTHKAVVAFDYLVSKMISIGQHLYNVEVDLFKNPQREDFERWCALTDNVICHMNFKAMDLQNDEVLGSQAREYMRLYRMFHSRQQPRMAFECPHPLDSETSIQFKEEKEEFVENLTKSTGLQERENFFLHIPKVGYGAVKSDGEKKNPLECVEYYGGNKSGVTTKLESSQYSQTNSSEFMEMFVRVYVWDEEHKKEVGRCCAVLWDDFVSSVKSADSDDDFFETLESLLPTDPDESFEAEGQSKKERLLKKVTKMVEYNSPDRVKRPFQGSERPAKRQKINDEIVPDLDLSDSLGQLT